MYSTIGDYKNKITKYGVTFIWLWLTYIMTKRATIMMDDDIDRKLRQIQAKMIQKENKSISYSYVVNSILKNSIK